MRTLSTVLLCVFSLVQPLLAQDSQHPRTLQVLPGDTGKAIVTALDFLRAIARDSVVLANCDAGIDSAATVHVRVGSTSIDLPAGFAGDPRCRAGAVRREGGALVVIDSVGMQRRAVVLPVWDQITFEIQVQVQYGRATREWHTLMVRPAGTGVDGGRFHVASWRVSSWRITRWMSH